MVSRLICGLAVAVLCAGVARCDDDRCEIADVTWELGPNLPEFRKGGCATALDGKVLSVFGMRHPWRETATMYVYDPHTRWWQRGPRGPIGQAYVQGTESGDAFYSIGGRSRQLGGVHAQCYRLRCKDGNYLWDRIADLNEPRAWAPSAAVDGKLYVLGGARGGHGPTLDSVEMLDLSQPQPKWRTAGRIPGESRGWSAAATVRGQIYLMGGSHFFHPKPAQGPDRKRLGEVWRLDPRSNQWQRRGPLPYRLSGFDCCVYGDRYILVVGGCPEAQDFTPQMRRIQQQDRFHPSYYCPFVLVYDTATDRWHRMPSVMPMPTNDIRVVLLDDKLYALGGENIEPATSNTTPWLRIGQIQLRKR